MPEALLVPGETHCRYRKETPHDCNRQPRNSPQAPPRWLAERTRLRARHRADPHTRCGRGAGTQPLHVGRSLYAWAHDRAAELCPAVSAWPAAGRGLRWTGRAVGERHVSSWGLRFGPEGVARVLHFARRRPDED